MTVDLIRKQVVTVGDLRKDIPPVVIIQTLRNYMGVKLTLSNVYTQLFVDNKIGCWDNT